MARKSTQGLNIDKLDQEIKDLGVRVRVWKSTICPNMTSLESLDHDINCTMCNNNMIDFAPVETIAIFQQQELLEQFKVQGTFNMDELIMSFLSGITLSVFTRVDLLDFSEDFYQLIQRQEGTDIDRLKYPSTCVLGIFTVTTNSKEEYHEGTDFTVDVNGDVKWISTHRPADREIYTIYYRYKPIYRAIKGMHRDRYTQFNTRPDDIKAPKVQVGENTYVKGPETWICKRDYLIERRDLNGIPLSKDEHYNPND